MTPLLGLVVVVGFGIAYWLAARWDRIEADRDGIREHIKSKRAGIERPARRPSEQKRFEQLKRWIRQQGAK